MSYLTYAERLNYLLEMIQKGQLTSPHNVSCRFGCSEKTVRNMINALREQGYKVEYCKSLKTYLLRY